MLRQSRTRPALPADWPAGPRAAPIGRQGDHGLQLRVLTELFWQQSALSIADGVQKSPDRFLADIYARLSVFGGGVVRQKVNDVVPVRAVDVVAVAALQSFDFLQVQRTFRPLQQLGGAHRGRCGRSHARRRKSHQTDQPLHISRTERKHRTPLLRPVEFSVSAAVSRDTTLRLLVDQGARLAA